MNSSSIYSYSVTHDQLQKHGQYAVEAFLNDARAREIITDEQYQDLQKSIVIAQTNNAFIPRIKKMLGITDPKEEGNFQVIWMVQRDAE